MPDEKFPIPEVDVSKVNSNYYRRTVGYDTKEEPGTIIADPSNYYIYRVEDNGSATRYGANIGRAGFLWSGDAYVAGRPSVFEREEEARSRGPGDRAGGWAAGDPGTIADPAAHRVVPENGLTIASPPESDVRKVDLGSEPAFDLA